MKTTRIFAGASRLAQFAGLKRASNPATGAPEPRTRTAPAGPRSTAPDADAGPSRPRAARPDQVGSECGAYEDDRDDEMTGQGNLAQARRREQARIAYIVSHPAAAAHPILAIALACETRMTRMEAVAVLSSQPVAIDPRGTGRGTNSIAKGWSAAFAKLGIATR